MGGQIAAILGAMVVGAATAQLLHDSAPALAWSMAAGLCVALFATARLFARQKESRLRVVGLLALAGLTLSCLMVLGGESIPRPVARDALGLVRLLVLLLAVLCTAAALPVLIVVAALWHKRPAESSPVRLVVTPQLVMFGLGVAAFALGVVLFAATLWATAPRWRVLTLVAVALGGPVLVLPLWTYLHERVLSRWTVGPPSSSLREGLEHLRRSTGFAFKRILFLDDSIGGGRLCGVVVGYGRATLLISQSLSDRLTGDQLLAVLAHEAAHVRLNHARRKLVWGFFGAVAVLATGIAALTLVGPLLPRALGFVGVLLVLLPLTTLRGLYDTFVVRRHEAEADAFAVHVAGATALLDALNLLGASVAPSTTVHNRWTTHSTWERRASNIKALGHSRTVINSDDGTAPTSRPGGGRSE